MKTTKWLFFAVILCSVTACQNTVNSLENKDKHANPNAISDQRFVTDGFLRDRLRLENVDVNNSAMGIMQVQVKAINVRVGVWDQMWSSMTGDNPYTVSYRFTWLNSAGMAVNSLSSSNWQNKIIYPGETVYFQATAPSNDCKDFLLNIREAQ